jgi:hypothetical protein
VDPPQGYAPPQYAPPAAPPVVLATGTIDQFYSQPTGSSGPGVSWKNKPLGTTYVGLVTRDVVQGDIQQDIDFQTKQPKFTRGGQPVFIMKVPLQVQPCQEFPEGEFTFYVRGQAREELVRAMAQAGLEGAPKGGALIQVTLIQRKPNQSGNPTNIVQISYTPDYNQVPAAPAPVQQQFQPQAPSPQFQAPQQAPQQVQYAQPAQQQVQPVQPQYAAPAPAAAPQVQYAAPAAAAPQAPAPMAAQAPVQQQAPAVPMQQPAPAGVPQPPANLDPNAQAILAQLTPQA